MGQDGVANIINGQRNLESKYPNSLLGEAWLTNSTVTIDEGNTVGWEQCCKEI